MWSSSRLLFLRQTNSRIPILEVCNKCKIRFFQFHDCGGHIFPQIVTKSRTEITLISADFVLQSELTYYSVVIETGNRIQILERCNFGFGIDFIRYRTIMCTILYRFHTTLRTAPKCGRLDACCF